MSSSDWIKYRIYCDTEAAWKEVIVDATAPLPSTCPTNTSHTVNASSVDEIARKSDLEFSVKEEGTHTNGYFHTYGETIIADCNTTTVTTVSKPWARSVLAIYFVTSEEHRGDIISLHTAPDTTVGVVTSAVTGGDTVLHVNSTVLDYVVPGFLLALYDGVNLDRLGHVNSVDKNAATVTVETAAVHSFSAYTTAVLFSVEIVKDMRISGPWEVAVGDSKIGGAYVPGNRNIRIFYTNRSPPFVVGTLAEACSTSDTVFTLSSGACFLLQIDDKLDLYDTTDNSSHAIGQITVLDPSNNRITVSGSASAAFAANTTKVRKVAKVVVFRPEILQ